MKITQALLCVLLFCSLAFSTTDFIQQCTAVGNTGSIDDSLSFWPTAGNTYLATVSHPASTTITAVTGDNGGTNLNRISSVLYSGVVMEVWKANNAAGTAKQFHVDFTGSDTVTVSFAEWHQ